MALNQKSYQEKKSAQRKGLMELSSLALEQERELVLVLQVLVLLVRKLESLVKLGGKLEYLAEEQCYD